MASENDERLQLPKKLRDDLICLCQPRVQVPPEVDEAIRAMAHQKLSPRPRHWRLRHWVAASAAAAAVLLVVLSVWPGRRPSGLPAVESGPSMDLDESGRVDILDAFLLARSIGADRPLREEWDVNRDGVVDQGDVNFIGGSAVSLQRGTL